MTMQIMCWSSLHLILEKFILCKQELNILVAKNKNKKAKSTGELANMATALVQASKHKIQRVAPRKQKPQRLN